MASDLHTDSGPSMTTLMGGIIGDAQELMKQQLDLFRTELREDIRKTKEALISLAIGAVLLAIGGFLLCFMAVYMLVYFLELPVWAGFAIVGGVFALIGGGLTAVAIGRFQSFNPLPDESAQALQENVRWITNPK